MKQVGVAELKDQLSTHLRAVEAGETVEVTDRGRPIARIVPTHHARAGRIRPAKRPFASVRDRTYPRLTTAIDSLELLRQERAERELPTEG